MVGNLEDGNVDPEPSAWKTNIQKGSVERLRVEFPYHGGEEVRNISWYQAHRIKSFQI